MTHASGRSSRSEYAHSRRRCSSNDRRLSSPVSAIGASDHPAFGQGRCALPDFDVVERLAKDQEAIGAAQFADDVFPGIIGVGRAEDDQDFRIDRPDLSHRLDAVPTWGHANIDEGDGVWLSFGQRFFDKCDGVLALKRRIDLVQLTIALVLGHVAE